MQVISDVLHNPEIHVPSSEDKCINESLTQNKVLPESMHNALSDLFMSFFFKQKQKIRGLVFNVPVVLSSK